MKFLAEKTTMERSHKYQAKLEWTGASQGPTASYESYSREHIIEIDGKPPLKVSADPMFRGDGSTHNPEDLLLAALAGCHMLSYLAVCVRAGIEVVSYEDAASGTLALEGGGGRFTEVVLRPRVVIAAGGDVEKARELHDIAHKQCFIANSMNFSVRHEPTVSEALRP